LGSGFTGIDLCLRDNPQPEEWIMSVIVSSLAISSSPLPVNFEIINDNIVDNSKDISTYLQNLLIPRTVISLGLENAIITNNICIFLSETIEPVISRCSKEYFEHVLRMLKTATGIIWVTRGSTMGCEVPEGSLITGLSRTARAENWDVKIS